MVLLLLVKYGIQVHNCIQLRQMKFDDAGNPSLRRCTDALHDDVIGEIEHQSTVEIQQVSSISMTLFCLACTQKEYTEADLEM